MGSHNATVVDQFTRQADAFAAAPAIRDDQALDLLVTRCRADANDDSLDVACGPGLVVCAFAQVVRTATGIDLTPAMVRKGESLAAAKGLSNATFQVGDVSTLPFAQASFSVVTSRYAFHHLADPVRVLREMVRVCRPDGRVAVMDMIASDDVEKSERFNRMERLRDPSHVEALTLAALRQCILDAGLPEPCVVHHKMDVELGAVLNASFPDEDDRERVREMVVASLADDSMGIQTRLRGNKVFFSYPIALLVTTAA